MRTRKWAVMTLLLALAAITVGCSRVGLYYAFDQQRPNGYLTQPNIGFRSGDRFRLKIFPDQDCYIYVLHEGTNGMYTMLYPRSTPHVAVNFVRKNQMVQIPEVGNFVVDPQPGVERLYLVAAKDQLPIIERFRGYEALPPNEVKAALQELGRSYNAPSARMGNRQGQLYNHIWVSSTYGDPVLKWDIDISHQP